MLGNNARDHRTSPNLACTFLLHHLAPITSSLASLRSAAEAQKPGPKRKLLKPNATYLSSAAAAADADVLPADLLHESLKLVPKLRKPE